MKRRRNNERQEDGEKEGGNKRMNTEKERGCHRVVHERSQEKMKRMTDDHEDGRMGWIKEEVQDGATTIEMTGWKEWKSEKREEGRNEGVEVVRKEAGKEARK